MKARWVSLVLLPLALAACAAPDAFQGVVQEPGKKDVPVVRAHFLKLIERPREDLSAEVRPATTADGLQEIRFTYHAEKDQVVPGILLKSATARGRQAVVIALHGTGGKKEDALPLMRDLARRGLVAVAIDGRYHGERAAGAVKDAGMNAYETAIFHAWQREEPHEHPLFYDTVWDVMRLVDYLETRADVDAGRVGIYGVSKGGIEAYMAAAVDTRIGVAVPTIAVQDFRWADKNNSWKSRVETFQKAFDAAAREAGVKTPDGAFVAKFYSRVAPGIDGEFDGPSLVPLIAPRPLMAINGEVDPRTPAVGLKIATDAIQAAYRAAGAEERFVLRIQANTAHQVRPEWQAAGVEWLVRWLRAG